MKLRIGPNAQGGLFRRRFSQAAWKAARPMPPRLLKDMRQYEHDIDNRDKRGDHRARKKHQRGGSLEGRR